MNLSNPQFPTFADSLSTTVSSPKLDLIEQTWEHIADRYLARIKSNRIFSGRIRSILSLAVYDALHSVIDPGNGHLFKETSGGSTIEAAAAAAVKASHDILSFVFTDPADREDLNDLLEESLSLFGKDEEKAAGLRSGGASAAQYLNAFAGLLLAPQPNKKTALRPRRELALAGYDKQRW